MNRNSLFAVFVMLALSGATAPGQTAPAPATNALAATNNTPKAPPPASSGPSLYNFTVKTLDGQPADLGQYRGKVALVVNTASRGGYTSQYGGLEKLYEDYKDKGFIVLAFPCNDFAAEESGSAKEIAELCKTRFNVTYPVFEKVSTHGPNASPVYQFLENGHGKPTWNFHKYLVDKSGNVIAEFTSQVGPESKDLRAAIDAAITSGK